MNPEELDLLIKSYEEQLEKLQPTLHPGGAIPYSKIGLLNTARRKEKKFQANLIILKLAKKNPNVPVELLNQLLEK